MRLSNSIINEVITEVAGEDVVPLVHALKNKKNYSEFKLAEALKQEINATRNMLYRLLKHNLVSFNRKKDKRKGWYIYYWTFNMKRIKYLLADLKRDRLERLKERLAREQSSNFFQCENQCMRLSFDQATDFNYKCPECGELLNQQDNTQIITSIEKEIKELEKGMKAKK
jgi:transcription initiation factor TFIIE subunit alpha